jgi:hypothetical protein
VGIHLGRAGDHGHGLRACRAHGEQVTVERLGDCERVLGRSGAAHEDPWSSGEGRPLGQRSARGERHALRREGDRAGDQRTGVDQGDLDGPVVAGWFGELAGAVQWIDDPDARHRLAVTVDGRGFLGQHGVGGKALRQPLDDAPVRRPVARILQFGAGRSAGTDGQQQLTRLLGDLGCGVGVAGHVKSVPPSTLMFAPVM